MNRNIVVGLVGHPSDRLFQRIARVAEPIADAVVVRRSVHELMQRSAVPVSHVIKIQSNRHQPLGALADFCRLHRSVKAWHVRGPLVAPPVQLPTEGLDIVDVSFRDCVWRLPGWLRETRFDSRPDLQAITPRSVFILASRLNDAEPIMDLVQPISPSVQWRRTMPGAESRGPMTCIWDDSVAPPGNPSLWQSRLKKANVSENRHVWLTSFATESEIQLAWQAGINATIAKPFYGETLLAALQTV